MSQFVQVQFKNRQTGFYDKAEYSYIADIPVQVGDIVTAPTKYGNREAKVCRVNVPITEIHCRVGQLRHITETGTPDQGIFAGFL